MEQKSHRRMVNKMINDTFRSEVYFDNDNRLTGTAAMVIVLYVWKSI